MKNAYFRFMHLKDRMLLFFDNDGHVVGGVTYVLTHDPGSLKRKNIWSIPREDADGNFIYLDRMTADRRQNISLGLKDLRQYLKTKYPDKRICWHSRRTGKLKEAGYEVYA